MMSGLVLEIVSNLRRVQMHFNPLELVEVIEPVG